MKNYRPDQFERCELPVNVSSPVSLQEICTGHGLLYGVTVGEVDSDGTFQFFDGLNAEITKPWTTANAGLWVPPRPMEFHNGLKITTVAFTGELAVWYVKFS